MVALPDINILQPTGLEAVRDFSDAASAFGLRLSGIAVPDGEIHRVVDTEASKTNISGWYVLTEAEGLLFGSFGSWKAGRGQQSWCSRANGVMSLIERQVVREVRATQQLAIEARRVDAAAQAEQDIATAANAVASHPYLVSKKVGSHGLLMDGDKLIIPVMDVSGKVISHQTIGADGSKRFLAGGRKKGGFFMIGRPSGVIYVAEGYSTAASVYEATGQCAVCAFDAGNLAPVVEGLRTAWPRAEIVIAADNDASGAGMDGARRSNPDRCVMPDVVGQDWNDVWVAGGADAVVAGVTRRSVSVMASTFSADDMRSVEPRRWLYGKHLIRGYVSTTVSPGGVGKTTLELTEAIALATGRDLLGVPVRERVRVWHYNLEDPRDELLRRAWAICEHYGIDPSELEDWLFLDSGRDCKMIVAEPVDGIVAPTVAAEQVIEQMQLLDIGLLQVDPLVKAHYAEENDNKQIDAVLDVFADVAKRCGAAIDLVHHTRKPPSGFVATAGDINTARGAGALAGAVRSARTITPMSDKEAEGFGILPARRSWYVRVDDAKGNMSAPSANAVWFERHSVALPQGDYVGVLASWSPPDPFDELGAVSGQRVLVEIERGLPDGQLYILMKQRNTTRWAGDLLIDEGVSEASAKSILRTWISSGLLSESTYRNPERRRDENGLFVDLTKMPTSYRGVLDD